MSPLRSILMDHVESGELRSVRFFYGARTQADLFNMDEFAGLIMDIPDFKFIPTLSAADDDAGWTGERGFVHEVLARHLRSENLSGEADAYSCGPPPMIDAILPVLQMNGVEPDHIYFDKFTPAVR
jgi:propane monooxygenase reductase subunit